MHWIELERSKHGFIQFKCDDNKDSKFNAINVRKYVAGRPQNLKNVTKLLLYYKDRL